MTLSFAALTEIASEPKANVGFSSPHGNCFCQFAAESVPLHASKLLRGAGFPEILTSSSAVVIPVIITVLVNVTSVAFVAVNSVTTVMVPPILVMVLNRLGLADVKKLVHVRPYVIVGAFVVAAIFTPPDVLSQLLLAVPLVVLYEAGIVCVRIFGKKIEDDEEKEDDEKQSA